ncbi:Ankyrin repeat domain-containing protein 13C-A [Goodea atripinnis]|uniref:Ankyrin repeat domain-containing protein 13C-A n=1 Tax=Goodea atripinnis TaxID=208336 RepID=A0ABV0PYD9_9TELE
MTSGRVLNTTPPAGPELTHIPLQLDTTLIDFTDMKCQRGDLSFIFNGNAIPSESFVVLDNEQKVYQRIHHEVSEIWWRPNLPCSLEEIADTAGRLICFFYRQERVGNFLADFYSVNGLVLESRKRREHLSEEDILRNKAIMESLSKGGNLIEQNFEAIVQDLQTKPDTIDDKNDFYKPQAPHLGRELVCKESKKNFKATIAMSQDFPLGIES